MKLIKVTINNKYKTVGYINLNELLWIDEFENTIHFINGKSLKVSKESIDDLTKNYDDNNFPF